MSSARNDRLADLFKRAAELPPDDRERFLLDECEDEALRDEVRDLLGHDAAAPSRFLAGSPRSPEEFALPESIGRYRVLRVIGVGGMGIVYEAEQDAPRRRVALKVIRPDFASASALQRFRREAEILGQLQHPGIAQIHEASVVRTTLGEQPFLAMELVAGEPIDAFAKRRGLAPRDRLSLIALVCDAVQHAHDRGVIHRDLKPANILVTETAPADATNRPSDVIDASMIWPKILDFGVARFTDGEALAATLRTEPGQIIGTLSYMSPEQVRSESRAVDGRADVYALGVILYELLCGRSPLDLAGRTLPEAVRLISEGEPSRLASRASEFRGDIDTIVGKAIEKDPARRYQSPGALATDIRRSLRDEPITARPASTLYQLRKFARRNRALVGGAAATFAALLIGLVLSVHFGLAAVADRNTARNEARRAERIAYRASLFAASAALSAEDVLTARRRLQAAPESLRGWEWHHLWYQLDRSVEAPVQSDWGRYVVRLGSGAPMPDEPRPYGCYDVNRDYTVEGWVEYESRRVYFRDIASGRTEQMSLAHLPRLVMPPHGLCDLAIDARRAVWTTDDGRVVTIDLDSPSGVVARTIADAARVAWARLSDDGRRLLVARSPGDVQVFDVDEASLLCTISGEAVEFSCGLFTHDGGRVILGRRNGPISMWDAASGRRLATAPVGPEHTRSIAISPVPREDVRGGYIVASCTESGVMRLYNAQLLKPLGTLLGHTGPVVGWFSADALTFVSYSTDPDSDEPMRLWDLRALEPDVLRGHLGYVYPVATTHDGRRLYSGGWDGYFGVDRSLRAWDVETGRPIETWSSPGWQWISSLACAPDGRLIVAGATATEGRVRVHAPDGTLLAEFTETHKNAPPLDLALHPDGMHLGVMPTGVIRNIDSGEIVARLAGVGGHGINSHPQGHQLAASDADHSITLWEAATWRPRATLAGHEAEVTCLRYSPGGQLLASASEDARVRIWHTRSRGEPGPAEPHSPLATLRHTDGVLAVAWHPDATRLATAGRGGVIRLWDTRTWEELTQLAGHQSYVYSLTFTPDGTCLVSGSGDHTIRLWRADGKNGNAP